jgi:hypothetical protein
MSDAQLSLFFQDWTERACKAQEAVNALGAGAPPTVAQVTTEAIEKAQRGADPSWLTTARTAVLYVAKTRPFFTTDEVWDKLRWDKVEPPREPRALGAVMRSMKAEGLITPTGDYRQSGRAEAHSNPKMLWRSTV